MFTYMLLTLPSFTLTVQAWFIIPVTMQARTPYALATAAAYDIAPPCARTAVSPTDTTRKTLMLTGQISGGSRPKKRIIDVSKEQYCDAGAILSTQKVEEFTWRFVGFAGKWRKKI